MPMPFTKTPFVRGTWIESIAGEQDADDDGEGNETGGIRQTGPNAIGHVILQPTWNDVQGWMYAVVFSNGTWVSIDQRDGIDDPTKYRVLYPD